MDPELVRLLDLAERASSEAERFENLDPLAKYGDAAVVAVRARRWLQDPRLGRFAVRVTSRAYTWGANKKTVMRALVAGLPDAGTPRIQEDILETLDRLDSGWRERDWAVTRQDDSRLTERLQDRSWPRRFMHAWTLWHLIVDETALPDGRRRFLSACHRWNSEEFVDTGDRRIQPVVDRKLYCSLCERADDRGGGSPSGHWHSVMAPWSGHGQLHLRRDRTWHLVEGKAALDATSLGTVYLTECGWWIEGPRLRAEGSGSQRSPICEPCERFAGSGATEESEA